MLTVNNSVSFPKLGIGFDINNVAFSIFGFKVYWYGIIIALAVTLAIIYGLKKAKKAGLDSDRVIDVVIVGFIGGIIGARLYFVAFKFEDYKDNLLEIFDIRNGGLAVYGGLILAIIAGVIMCRIRKVKILPMLDIAGLGFLIGQGVGRWANFVNVEAFGSPTRMPWGMSSPLITAKLAGQYPTPVGEELMVHPTFFYESVWCLIGFVLLHLLFNHRKYDGQIFFIYCAWYGAERFFVEGLRTDSLMVGPLRVSQLLSGIIVVAALAALVIMGIRVKENPRPLYVDTDESKQLLAQKEKIKRSKIAEDPEDGGSSDCSDPQQSEDCADTFGFENDAYNNKDEDKTEEETDEYTD